MRNDHININSQASNTMKMKILHTSDWHLGQVLYDHDRTAEHQDFLRQLGDIIEREKPHALLVCGDVFDRVNPTLAARQLYTHALLDQHDRYPQMQIIVTAGNHDGKSNLDLEGLVWDRLEIKVVGQVERDNDGQLNLDRHIIEIKDEGGHPMGYVVAVPHIFEQNYPQIDNHDERENRQQRFFQALLDRVKAQNAQHLPVVLSAHLALSGSDFSGHDQQMEIGGMTTVDADQLGDGYDYLALGHIHTPQTFAGEKHTARYCGTPIAISFDEKGRHGVSLVTFEEGRKPVIEEIPIRNPKPLLTIPEKAMPFDEALAELAQFPLHEPAYIRLNVLADAPLPANYVAKIIKTLEGKEADYCCVKLESTQNSQKQDADTIAVAFDADNMPTMMELADKHWKKLYGTTLPDELKEYLGKAIKASKENETLES